jgi:hypothetical protein
MDGAEISRIRRTGSGRLASTIGIERVTRTELVGKTWPHGAIAILTR